MTPSGDAALRGATLWWLEAHECGECERADQRDGHRCLIAAAALRLVELLDFDLSTLPVPSELRAVLVRLDTAGRCDGLVPLPMLRQALGHIPRAALDGLLLGLHRDGRLELKIANDRRAVDARQGIELPDGRGLLFYAVVR